MLAIGFGLSIHVVGVRGSEHEIITIPADWHDGTLGDPDETWIAPLPNGWWHENRQGSFGASASRANQVTSESFEQPQWHWAPTGLIYRSYMAGPHEPRMALFTFHDFHDQVYMDATLGGRIGLVRFGNTDPVHLEGYQLDFYGATISRLDVDSQQDLEAVDYVFGFPLTWGDARWQFKFGYAHTSSHMGDERAIRIPGEIDKRINYVRDGFVFGVSHFPLPMSRLYWEAGWAFHRSGGARPWDTQFGIELTEATPGDFRGAPFLAVNGRLRQELQFGGDVSAQAGWLRKGMLGQTFRVGGEYYNGRSSQFQFHRKYEQQLGLGVWYDF